MGEPDGLGLTERLVTAAELAQIIGIDEADVLAWIESGELDVQRGEDGEALLPIREHRGIDGPSEVRIATTERGMVDVLDVRGGGAGVDLAFVVAASGSDACSPADRVVLAGLRLLEVAQERVSPPPAERQTDRPDNTDPTGASH